MQSDCHSRAEVIVWEAGQSWAAALRQWRQTPLTIAVTSDYDNLCSLTSKSPYAVSLWEVNLFNWEDRVQRLGQFRRRYRVAGVVVAIEELGDEVQELFQELGAAMILKDRLSAAILFRALDRLRQVGPPIAPNWRDYVTTTLPWLNDADRPPR